MDLRVPVLVSNTRPPKKPFCSNAGRGAGVNRRGAEVEQSWCNDLAKVNKLLAERGIRAEVLREDGPGTAAQLLVFARDDRKIDAPSRPNQLERKS